MVQSIQLNTNASVIGEGENHDCSSEGSNVNDEDLQVNENDAEDDFDDDDEDDNDVDELDEENDEEENQGFLSPKVEKSSKKAAKGLNSKGVLAETSTFQSPLSQTSAVKTPKKTFSRGNWTPDEDELLRAGCQQFFINNSAI